MEFVHFVIAKENSRNAYRAIAIIQKIPLKNVRIVYRQNRLVILPLSHTAINQKEIQIFLMHTGVEMTVFMEDTSPNGKPHKRHYLTIEHLLVK